MDFTGKVVLVTGGARGIGAALARRFHALGAHLAIGDVNLAGAQEVAAELSARGPRSAAYACDVSQTAAAEGCLDQVLKDFQKIDVLVNNAGITKDGLLLRMTDEAWQRVLAINLTGAFLMLRAVAKPMLKARSGAIVNIASVVGLWGNPGQANYSASKAGLIGLTKTAAKEFGPRGVRVNAVAPGFIETEMTAQLKEEQKQQMLAGVALGRMGRVEDVAAAVCFLASDEAGYVTGQVLEVCGGLVM